MLVKLSAVVQSCSCSVFFGNCSGFSDICSELLLTQTLRGGICSRVTHCIVCIVTPPSVTAGLWLLGHIPQQEGAGESSSQKKRITVNKSLGCVCCFFNTKWWVSGCKGNAMGLGMTVTSVSMGSVGRK